MANDNSPLYVYALEDCTVPSGDGISTVSLRAGEAWHAADPFVQARSDLFSADPPRVRNTQGYSTPPRQPLRTMTRRPGAIGR